MILVQQSEATAALRRMYFHCVDATDGMTPETGEADGQPQISLNGAAWGNTTNVLVAIGNGRYYVELVAATEVNAVGVIEGRYKSANTAEAIGTTLQVVPFDPYSFPEVNLKQISGQAIDGDTYGATLQLKHLDIQNSNGDAITALAGGTNKIGMHIAGSNGGSGIFADGGETGVGILGRGEEGGIVGFGVHNGPGIHAIAGLTSGNGFVCEKGPEGKDIDADEIDAILSRIGTPVDIDSGGSTLADNLKKIADDNGGASFDATTDSLERLANTAPMGTAMRGTDGANTTVPDAAGTAAALHATTDGKVDAVKAVTDDMKVLDTTIASVTTPDTVFTLTAGLTGNDDPNNAVVSIYDDTGSIWSGPRRASDYVHASKTLTIDADTAFPLAAGDRVVIWNVSYATTAAASAISAGDIADIVDGVWDESQADHIAVGSTGLKQDHSDRHYRP